LDCTIVGDVQSHFILTLQETDLSPEARGTLLTFGLITQLLFKIEL